MVLAATRIGGVGGSGTRLIAPCLKELGVFIGPDLNAANDNLWFTLLFKRTEIVNVSEDEFNELGAIFINGMLGSEEFSNQQIELITAVASEDRGEHSASWLRDRARTLLSSKPMSQPSTRWGWKEPNSHIVLGRLIERFQNMKYIHVVRNGLDMAHSWGRYFIGEDFDISPYYSFKYWCIIHRRVLDITRSTGANVLFLNYDNFCLNPEDGISELCGFLELDPDSALKSFLLALVSPPDSIGRFKKFGTQIFDEDDVAYVKKLGFDVGETTAPV